MKTDLDALLTALYVHLDDDVIPLVNRRRAARAVRPCSPTPNSSASPWPLVLLRHDSERHRMRAAPHRIGHLFPRLPGQSEYNRHLRDAAPLLFRAAMWLARAVPTWWEHLWLMDARECAQGPWRPGTLIHPL
ncbi:hypothetical protein BJF83_12630 [Nocardiopsis sp. CNR-923]|uniref:hypothetical protein n=1 Tax=Nocardiopsis sp. CNR-923 TaxID=1904965 RepID=UPI00095909AB|nr:hypothetical protein [Nocardiopsis sp. CNR-923]OLT29267.1 hypothetical protein BJF83_12630 [Nocardiopsis sp. CNR-923]